MPEFPKYDRNTRATLRACALRGGDNGVFLSRKLMSVIASPSSMKPTRPKGAAITASKSFVLFPRRMDSLSMARDDGATTYYCFFRSP